MLGNGRIRCRGGSVGTGTVMEELIADLRLQTQSKIACKSTVKALCGLLPSLCWSSLLLIFVGLPEVNKESGQQNRPTLCSLKKTDGAN